LVNFYTEYSEFYTSKQGLGKIPNPCTSLL